ncbi:hypothetical protein Tco_0332168 [Tanacetum coccineum]
MILYTIIAKEIITLPSRIAVKFEEKLKSYIELCEIQLQSTGKYDLIPPGVENDDSEDEDNELPNLDHQDNPSSPRPPPELPDVEKCLEPKAGILITKVFKVVSKPHGFMADILPTLPTLVSDLPSFSFSTLHFSPSISEDSIF